MEYPTQIIFINDGSEYEVGQFLDKLKSKYNNILLITHANPQGCAKSINDALEFVEGEFTVFIDSDTILTPQWQKKIETTFDNNPKLGALGAMLVYPQTGAINNCGLAFAECMPKHLFYLNKPINIIKTKIIDVQFTMFAFCAIPTNIIKKIGKMDENFFNGNEDLDYQLRIHEEGYTIAVNPNLLIYHWERSNGIHRKFNQRNNLTLLWKKHGDMIKNDLWNFIDLYLKNFLKEETHPIIVINLSESHVDSSKLLKLFSENYDLNEVWDFSFCCNVQTKIWLPQLLNSDALFTQCRYVFLCDTFIELTENAYWFNLRKKIRNDDIIVDMNGNVLLFNNLQNSFWPGNKLR